MLAASPPDTASRSAAAPRSVGTDKPAHPAYRPDIDGLRAVAVLAVLAYHAFPGTAKGGFVGVDVFFVISGFLISTIIFGNLENGRFALVDFYVRRIKRIFPALLVVLSATVVFGWYTLMADEYQQLGKHVAAGAAFVSNFVFWQESGYFDTAAEAKPLLHLWSLGIEEQFYIVWPVLLWMLWRIRTSVLSLMVCAALASFAFNLHLMRTDPVADFYSPYSRLWELALGSLLAYLTLFRQELWDTLPTSRRNVMSLLGAALLSTGLLAIRSSSVFPGFWALLPTVGAVAIIGSGSQAWFNRKILANRLLVWFGLISFPLYLWHWPILSFVHVLAAERPTRTTRIAALALSVALAWLTYRLVERPIRLASSRRWLPTALLAVMLGVGAFGFASFCDGGFASRAATNLTVVNDGDLGTDAFYKYPYTHFAVCNLPEIRQQAEVWSGSIRCFQSHNGPVDLAIIGDSHAEHLFIGLAEALPDANVAFYIRSSLPVMGNEQFKVIYDSVVRDPRIHVVILSAWWSLRFSEAPPNSTATAELRTTVEALTKAGKTVFIADDTPNFSFSPRLCKYTGGVFRAHKCQEDADFYGRQLATYTALLDALQASDPRVKILKLAPYFCSETACSMVKGGQLLFRDSDHLSVLGSQYLGKRIVADHPELATLADPAR